MRPDLPAFPRCHGRRPAPARVLTAAALLAAVLGHPALVAAWEVAAPDVVLRGVSFPLVLAAAPAETVRVVVSAAPGPDGNPAWRIAAGGGARPVAVAEAVELEPVADVPPALEAEVGDAVRILRTVVLAGGPAGAEVEIAGVRAVTAAAGSEAPLVVAGGGERRTVAPRVLAGWMAVLPPLLAITLALIWRQVVVALLLGVWLAAVFLNGGDPLAAFLQVADRFLVQALADPSHASIVLFSTTLGGMVGILAKAGASAGLVRALAGRVGGRRGGQTATAAMGTAIFFDDYANTLLVGSTMRPLTDGLRISREKLAYLVDSTAAPIATLAVISTWVGFEVGLIQEAMADLGRDDGSAYTFFLRTLPLAYYPWLTLLCVYLVAATGRDWGPMLAAERRALLHGQVLRPGARPASASLAADQDAAAEATGKDDPAHPLLAVIPIATVIAVTALGLVHSGRQGARAAGLVDPTLRETLNHADSFAVLMWASLAGAILAGVLAVAARRLSLRGAVDGWLDGARAMLIAVTILLLAWALSAACGELHTADYLVEVCRGLLSARWLPAVVFLLAAAVSFATGTSWGTMAILMPLVYPLGAVLPGADGLAPAVAERIHLAAVGAVLAGAVFGDHCSPISDTTIMSSLASGSDHVDHVRTQLPYAVAVGGIAMATGYLPVGYGVPPLISLPVGALMVAGLVVLVGRPVRGGDGETASPQEDREGNGAGRR